MESPKGALKNPPCKYTAPSVLEINMTTVATLAVLALVFAFLIDAGPVLVPILFPNSSEPHIDQLP